MILTDDMRRAATTRIGQNLRAVRVEHGWSLSQMELKTGIDYCSLKRWELGYNSPPANVMPCLAHAYGVSLERLFEGA